MIWAWSVGESASASFASTPEAAGAVSVWSIPRLYARSPPSAPATTRAPSLGRWCAGVCRTVRSRTPGATVRRPRTTGTSTASARRAGRRPRHLRPWPDGRTAERDGDTAAASYCVDGGCRRARPDIRRVPVDLHGDVSLSAGTGRGDSWWPRALLRGHAQRSTCRGSIGDASRGRPCKPLRPRWRAAQCARPRQRALAARRPLGECYLKYSYGRCASARGSTLLVRVHLGHGARAIGGCADLRAVLSGRHE